MPRTPAPCLVHVLATLNHGGNETQALTLIQHWPGAVRHVVLVLAERQGPMLQRFQQCADVHGLPQAGVQRWLACYRLLAQARPQALLSYTFQSPLLPVVMAARLAGTRRIAVRIGNTPPEQGAAGWRWFLLASLLQLLGASLHPVSQAVRQGLMRCGVHLSPRAVMRNGVAIHAEAPPRAVADRAGVVLMVGRLDGIKDQATLIRAFASLRPALPHWQLQLAGEGPERPALEALCRELGLDPARILLGACSDVPQRLAQAGIFAFSTTAAEGSPNALLEAMASSLPILASDVPPCRELLADGQHGQLLPAADSAAWAAALQELMGHPGSRLHWSDRAAQGAEAFDACLVAQHWQQLLAGC